MRKRRLFLFFLLLGIFVTTIRWWTDSVDDVIHSTPTYEREDLLPIILKKELKPEDYETIFCQTGLARAAVDELLSQNRGKEILQVQELFFREVETKCERYWVIVHSERITNRKKKPDSLDIFLPTAQTGDILITFNGHVFGWRCGHAALITDAEKGETLEAISIGRNSEILPLEQWEDYPSFILLRLKNASAEKRKEIAGFASAHLEDIPYRLPCIVQKDSSGHEVSGTHCAHLVWYAFDHYGYDLNSDGGGIVTPKDIHDSNLLEVVQVYGVPMDNYDK